MANSLITAEKADEKALQALSLLAKHRQFKLTQQEIEDIFVEIEVDPTMAEGFDELAKRLKEGAFILLNWDAVSKKYTPPTSQSNSTSTDDYNEVLNLRNTWNKKREVTIQHEKDIAQSNVVFSRAMVAVQKANLECFKLLASLAQTITQTVLSVLNNGLQITASSTHQLTKAILHPSLHSS